VTFMHKLACRLSLLKARSLATAALLLSVAVVFSCERPVTLAGVDNNSVAVLVVTPNAVTLQPNQMQDFVAVGLTAAGDTASIGVTWSATAGSIDTSSNGGRHYGHYRNASCGAFQVIATSHPGDQSDTANVTVSGCQVPVATVTVSPSSASVSVGQTVQLTATPRDANGNALSGRVVTWASSNTSVATVSGAGLVTGRAAGSATIAATSEAKSGAAVVTVQASPPPPGCAVSSLTWGNTPLAAAQTGSFTVEFDATPNGTGLDAVTGLSAGPAAAFADLAVIVRFNSGGTIDARNGGAYGAASAIAYAAGTSYHFRLVVDVPSHTYSAYVTPAGGTEQTIGTGFAFRIEQNAVASLANWALYSDAGTHTVCNFTLGSGVPPAPVASVDVSPATASLPVGATVQLVATPRDASGNPLPGRVVTWASSNTTVATVSASGLVTGKVAGTATITATSEGQSGTAAITVTAAGVPVASVSVTPATAQVFEGQTVQLTATPRDSGGNVLSGRTVTWASSNTSVATVSASGLVTGKVAGTATITATSEGQSGTSTITVVHVPVASVSVTPATPSLNEGKTVQLTATPRDSSGNALSGRTVTWASSNTSVATVSASGLVTGKVAGTATITATSEGQNGTSTVTVVHPPVASVSVTPGSATVPVGATLQLTATPKDATGSALTGRSVTWASSNTSVATVSATGLVTGQVAGTATITATSEGQSGTAAITVTPPGTSQFGHVFIVTEENTDAVDVTSSSMPYLMGLAQQYGLSTQYYANTHPSIGNYFELATGQVLTNNDGSSTIQTVDNVVRELLAAGKTWKSYAENLPNACYLGGDTGGYARKHNVFALLSDVANNATQACNIVPFTQFPTDLANGTLPSFSNIVPNLCNDAHDCSLSTADRWLSANIAPLLASPVFQQDGLLIITFDEAGGDNTLGGGRVFWAVISPKAKRGYQSSITYQHPSTLRLILKGLGVTVYPGAAASAPDMSEFFTP